jgi:hypothetical protein
MNWPQPGDTFSVHMGWTLPGGDRLHVTFQVEVEALEPDRNRMRCRLLRIEQATGTTPEAEVDPGYFQRVLDLVGKRANIPLEAREGLVLPLRLATLTGEHGYFFD